MRIIRGSILLVIALGTLLLIVAILSDAFEHRNDLVFKKELIAFNDGFSTEGSFFLGSGTIQERNYYFMYIKNDDGGIKQLKVATENAVIYEEERSNGIIERYYNGVCRILIPKGTVIRQFKADLE